MLGILTLKPVGWRGAGASSAVPEARGACWWCPWRYLPLEVPATAVGTGIDTGLSFMARAGVAAAAPVVAWIGDTDSPAARDVRAQLRAAGLQLPPTPPFPDNSTACVIACPPADAEALHASFAALPSLQDLSLRVPARRVLVWDPCAENPATVATDVGMTGIQRPAEGSPPSNRDPWHRARPHHHHPHPHPIR